MISMVDQCIGRSQFLDETTPDFSERDWIRMFDDMIDNNLYTLAVTLNTYKTMKVNKRYFHNMKPIEHYKYFKMILHKFFGTSYDYMFWIDYNKRHKVHIHGIISFNCSSKEAVSASVQLLATKNFGSTINDIRELHTRESWKEYCFSKTSFPVIWGKRDRASNMGELNV